MKILVTGADGFVGGHLTRYLRANGDQVSELRGADADVTDAAAVTRIVAEHAPEGVIHLAGFSSVGQSHAEPSRAFAVNLMGTVHVLEALRKLGGRRRALLISSGEVYGRVADGHRARETDPLAPLSPYAASKAAAELAGFQFFRSYGLDVVCARPFNHLGAGQAPHFVVPSFARQLWDIKRGADAPRLEVGNLEPVRDFSHVDDVVRAYRLLLQKGVAGEAYNIASGVGRTIRQVLDELRALIGVEVEPTVVPERVRPAEIPSLLGDASKLHALGFSPARTVTEALKDVIADISEAPR